MTCAPHLPFPPGGECGVPTVERFHTPAGTSPSKKSPSILRWWRRSPLAPLSSAGSWLLSAVASWLSGPHPPLKSETKAAGALFYSFDRGAVHFIILDSEMPSDPESDQGR